MKKIQITRNWIIPNIYFFLTFFLERISFSFSWNNVAFRTSIPMNQVIGDKTEMVMTYVISKMFAALILVVAWKIILAIRGRYLQKKDMWLFFAIFIVGLIIGTMLYPDSMGFEVDNYCTYAMATRFLPTYWHSIYTGAFYAACLMVIPHPIGIFIIQWLFFISVVAYIYTGVAKMVSGGRLKYLVFVIFALPETYDLIFNAYRNNLYTIVCLFYFSYIFFAYADKKLITKNEQIIICLLSAFLMVWRSEGIFIGTGGMVLVLYLVCKKDKKTIISMVCLLVCSFFILSEIQGLGSKKYYGKDYTIVSSTNVLQSILNNPDAKLDTEDLYKLEAVVPVQILKENGIKGYRDYNYTVGRVDGNQSLASDKAAKEYLRSYYKIVFENLGDYIGKQFGTFLYSIDYPFIDKSFTYEGNEYVELNHYEDIRNAEGKEQLEAGFITKQWKSLPIRQSASDKILSFYAGWKKIMSESHLGTLYKLLPLLGIVEVLLYEIYSVIRKRKYSIYSLIISIIIIVELAAIIAFMPEARAYYLYPMIYTSYLLILFRALVFNDSKEGSN